jgi:hypothetical protein
VNSRDFLYGHKIADFIGHPQNLRGRSDFHGLVNSSQPEGLECRGPLGFSPVRAFLQSDPNALWFGHLFFLETQNFSDGLSPESANVLGLAETLEALHRSLGDISLIFTSERLRQNIFDTGDFENRADGASGDDTGASRGGFQKNARGAEFAHQLVRNGGSDFGDGIEILGSFFDRLADGVRHLGRFAVAQSDSTLTVTHGHQGAEREPTTALDDLGAAIDMNNPFQEFGLLTFLLILSGTPSLSVGNFSVPPVGFVLRDPENRLV